MNKTNPIRQLTVVLLFMLALPLSAQEDADSVFAFRFLARKDMFFSPGMNNENELARLFDCVDRHKKIIKDRQIPLHVDGYCASKNSDAENLAITRNHPGQDEFVTGSFIIPEKDAALSTQQAADIEPQPAVPAQSAVADTPARTLAETSDSRFALKTNLLGYLVLMPNVEAEWKFANRWSAALEYQCAWWSKSSPRKVYRLATVTPELRYWAISRSRWHGLYVGLFGGYGLYDLSNKKKGHEGEGFMAGVSAGYMWPITKHLSLDAGIGVGYMHARDKEYIPRDGHFLYQLTKNINYVGPLRAKLSLVWRIPY